MCFSLDCLFAFIFLYTFYYNTNVFINMCLFLSSPCDITSTYEHLLVTCYTSTYQNILITLTSNFAAEKLATWKLHSSEFSPCGNFAAHNFRLADISPSYIYTTCLLLHNASRCLKYTKKMETKCCISILNYFLTRMECAGFLQLLDTILSFHIKKSDRKNVLF